VCYFNIKAFDHAGNLSDYGETTWVEGYATVVEGVQLLTNADWERDLEGQTNMPDWFWMNGWMATEEHPCLSEVDYGNYGRDGSKGLYLSLACYDDDDWNYYCRWHWPGTAFAHYGSWMRAAEPNRYVVASVFFKTTLARDYWYLAPTEGYEPHDGFLVIEVTPLCHDGDVASVVPADRDILEVEELQDNWYRLSRAVRLTSDDTASCPYLGWQLYFANKTAATVDFYLDRPKLEYGRRPSEWTPCLDSASDGGTADGVKLDVAGIYSSNFKMDKSGKIHTSIERSASGVQNIGTPGDPWDNIYCDVLHATTVYGGTLTGGEWEHSDDMIIDAHKTDGDSTLSIVNQDATITLGGTVDGVDLAAFKSTYDAHDHSAGNPTQISHANLTNVTADQHHSQVHALVGGDHTASGLTVNHVLLATSATTFAFGQLDHGATRSMQHWPKMRPLSVHGTFRQPVSPSVLMWP